MAVRRRPAREAPGQHFLRSSRLAADLVREAGVTASSRVVEVGAGTGVLTRALALTGASVVALELDSLLAAKLRRRFESRANVSVVEADALRWNPPSDAFVVVANLPFAGSGALVDSLLGDPRTGLASAHVIVQWEFAVKHAAVWPATLHGVCWGAWFELTIAGRLARTAFAPPPTVDAAVLRVARRLRPLVPVEDRDDYRRFLTRAFRSREPVRRALAADLGPLEVKRLAPVLGFAPDARARDLDARQWAGLFAVSRSPSSRSCRSRAQAHSRRRR